MKPLPLKISLAPHPHTDAITRGHCPIEGVAPDFVEVVPPIAAYRRMVRHLEFDVCEMAPTTYLIARAHGAPFIGLPVFLMRRFHHAGLLVRGDAGISHPKQLEGKRVGVRAYSVTTGVWTRGILADEYGLDGSKVTWVVDDEEHVSQLALPPNVEHAPPGRSLAALMAAGELQAGFSANAGIGREGAPLAGWDRPATVAAPSYQDLFESPETLEADWFRRTGIYPVHGMIVIKEQLVAENPWLPSSLFAAFSRAKQDWLARLDSGEADAPQDRKNRQMQAIVGRDPLPYGLDANRRTVETLQRYAQEQKLVAERPPLETLFLDPQTNDESGTP